MKGSILRAALAAGALTLGAGLFVWFSRPPAQARDYELADVLAAVNLGEFKPARDALASWEGRFGFDQQIRLVRGALLLRNGQSELALREFAALRPTGSIEEPACLWTGECLYRLGRHAEAERVFAQLASLNAKSVDAHRWLGAVYFDLGAFDAAIGEMKKVAQLDASDYRPHRLIGLMCLDFGIADEAIAAYREALKLSPPADVREEIARDLAKSLIQLRDFEGALEALKSATPDALSAALQAECFWNIGRQAEADERMAAARAFDPDERRLRLLEAFMHLAAGTPQGAVEPMQRALKRDPHDAECRYQLALAYRQMGKLADSQREMAEWQKAKDLATKLTELNVKAIRDPANVDVRRDLAVVCEKLGKHELAEMWRKAVSGYPESPPGQTPRGSIMATPTPVDPRRESPLRP